VLFFSRFFSRTSVLGLDFFSKGGVFVTSLPPFCSAGAGDGDLVLEWSYTNVKQCRHFVTAKIIFSLGVGKLIKTVVKIMIFTEI